MDLVSLPKTVRLDFLSNQQGRRTLLIRAVGAVADGVTDPGAAFLMVTTLRLMHAWLVAKRYTWRPGSNGLWDAPR